jgi:predicted P-loop ATPase
MRALRCIVVCGTALVAATIWSAPIGAAQDEWVMPDLIGKDLQGAQDAIQSLTALEVWYTDSTDLTGQDRMQVSDRHWVVCTSTPPPGATFTADTDIDFGVVRIEETCP